MVCYFRDIGDDEPDSELLDLAKTLIDKKSGKFDASEFHDRYVDALKELIERKKQGKTLNIDNEDSPVDARGGNVVDLMAALKKSLGSGGASAASAKKPPVKTEAKKPARKKA